MSKRALFILWGLCGATIALAALLYPVMPERLASHWNALGEVDGYTGRLLGLFLLPLSLAFLALLYSVIPRIDPLRQNIEAFRKQYDALFIALAAVMSYFFAAMLAWNLGVRFDFTLITLPVIGAFIFWIGYILPRTRRNWFIGIRTPWTLSSDRVWEETHRFGSGLFKGAGVAIILSIFIPSQAYSLMVALVIAAVLAPVVYSYFIYRKENS